MPFAPSSFLFLVVRPGAPSSVLAPSIVDEYRTHKLWISLLTARKTEATSAALRRCLP